MEILEFEKKMYDEDLLELGLLVEVPRVVRIVRTQEHCDDKLISAENLKLIDTVSDVMSCYNGNLYYNFYDPFNNSSMLSFTILCDFWYVYNTLESRLKHFETENLKAISFYYGKLIQDNIDAMAERIFNKVKGSVVICNGERGYLEKVGKLFLFREFESDEKRFIRKIDLCSNLKGII